MQNPMMRTLQTLAAVALSVTAASCGGSGASGETDLVLVSFNLPDIAGVALNTPLIYTFSDNVEPTSATPDTLQVNGSPSFTFQTIVVDGNLVAELPFIPNFEDYSDSGLAPGTTYTVFLPIFPAVDTVRSTSGRPLVIAESFSFTTNPVVTFIEPRRPITHGNGPFDTPAGRGDDNGCLNNPTNSLYVSPDIQFGSGPDARLLCLKNEGPPHVILDQSIPTQDQRAVGTPAGNQGLLNLPAIRVRFNEPLDPITVVPYIPTTQLSLNIQLWHVGDSDAIAGDVRQIKTNKPLVVQNLDQAEAILVAVGAQVPGTYLVNIQGCRDLPGNLLVTSDSPNPAPGGYAGISTAIFGIVPPGYRIYFRTLELPATGGSITESFGNNLAEATTRTFTRTNLGTSNLVESIPSSPATGAAGFTFVQTEPGQTTTANWNGTNRFLGLSKTEENSTVDDGLGRLKAVFEPYLGNGDDGDFTLTSGSSSLSSAGGDFNNDGVYEFQNFTLGVGATLTLSGPNPVLLLIRGTCTINGTITGNGQTGGFGIDTDGTVQYTNPLAILGSGAGGLGGPGGGAGGHGSPQGGVNFPGDAAPGVAGNNLYGALLAGGGSAGAVGDGSNQGGGGGGFGTAGSGGSGASNGIPFGTADFTRALALFSPERCYQPSANLSGGGGGGGGGLEDDNGTSETGNGSITVTAGGQLAGGDDGGAGGGGAGGGLWIIARTITVGATGIIRMNGGRGGNSFGPAAQIVFDPNPNNSNDEYVTGVTNPDAAGTGQGGGGGGGSGGAILLEARDALAITAGATLQCTGGAAGTTGSAKNGGVGGNGRIGFLGFAATTEAAAATMSVAGGATITPAAGVQAVTWKPTVDGTSQGVSKWIDLVTPTAQFNVPVTSIPFWTDNLAFLTSAGLVQGPPPTGDFNAIPEYQGAATVVPSATDPTSGTGLTAWSTNVATLNFKTFFRWRWRFFVNRTDSNAGNNPDFDPMTNAMPAILDFTIPFQK